MAKKTPEINASSTADIAFLLLAFFLATTTMNVDSGLFRRLPPYQEDNEEAPKVAARNVLQVLVNRNNQLLVNDEVSDINSLKDRTKEFIMNKADNDDMPAKEAKEIPLFGAVEVSKGLVSLQSDRQTSYETYVAVQDQLTAAFREMRDEKAMEKWGKVYADLDDEQKDAVNKYIPMNISEAEPRNVVKK